MPLTGEAKAAYQRAYMQRRRARGEPQPPPQEPASASREAELLERIAQLEAANAKAEAEAEMQILTAVIIKGPAKARPPRTPVDPDSALGVAKTTIAGLHRQLRKVANERDDAVERSKRAGLSEATFKAVVKALHRDCAAISTPESREQALAILNAELDQRKRGRPY